MRAPLAIILIATTTAFISGLVMRNRVAKAGLTITSWFRDPITNFFVGGKFLSQHQYFMAIDVAETHDLARAKLRRAGYKIVVNEGDHLHAQRFKAANIG